jgi:hypothetical protein
MATKRAMANREKHESMIIGSPFREMDGFKY